MNTLEGALARRERHAAWLAEVAALDAAEKPVPVTKKPVGRPRTHGHYVAYRRHIQAGEDPCPPCIEANEERNEQVRERKRRQREARK